MLGDEAGPECHDERRECSDFNGLSSELDKLEQQAAEHT
jgi:hypothetical protein